MLQNDKKYKDSTDTNISKNTTNVVSYGISSILLGGGCIGISITYVSKKRSSNDETGLSNDLFS